MKYRCINGWHVVGNMYHAAAYCHKGNDYRSFDGHEFEHAFDKAIKWAENHTEFVPVDHNGMTPLQTACNITREWIECVLHCETSDLDDMELTYRKMVRRYLRGLMVLVSKEGRLPLDLQEEDN